MTLNEGIRVGEYGAEKMNCLLQDEEQMLECLQVYWVMHHKIDLYFHFQGVDTNDLQDLLNDRYFWPVTAVIDGTLLPKLPHDIVAEGGINAKEVILGSNKDEGLLSTYPFILDPTRYEEVKNNWSREGPGSFFGKRYEGNITDITQQDIDQAYQVIEDKLGSLDNLNSEHFDEITAIMTTLYLHYAHTYAEMLTQQGVTVYQYLFTYKGNKMK